MSHIYHNPDDVPKPVARYSQAVEVRPGARYLFLSGQIGITLDGKVPETFEEQCHLIYGNIVRLLATANMTPADLVKTTAFLTRLEHRSLHGPIRREYFGDAVPASTAVVVPSLMDPTWLLEVEAIAASDA
jgi:enamine deaminase RidA (YjgF/YER057c/UK114 family)